MSESTFSGVILQQKAGQQTVTCAGYRDRANRIANQLDTKFGTASLGKCFVAVAILQLIEAEKLSLTTSLAELYQQPLGTVDLSITMYELLTHKSGLQDYFDELVETDYEALWRERPNYSIRKNQDVFPMFIDKVQNPDRRGQFIYNNAGYVVLADVIERLTGQPFTQVLQEQIFEPLAMEQTGYFSLDQLPANTASAYIKQPDDTYRTNIYAIDCMGTGAGGCYSTALDLVRFWSGLFAGTILPKKTVAEMIKKQAGNENEAYGLGVWLTQTPYIFLQGSDPGISCISLYNPLTTDNFTAISNCADDVWQLARNYLAEMT